MHIERLLAAAIFCSLLCCGSSQTLTPDEVATQFWRAIESGNAKAARKYVSAEARSSESLGKDILELEEISFGKVIIDGESAIVETTVVVLSDRPLTLPLNTVLVKEGAEWKVDYNATVSSISLNSALARVLQSVREYGERFASQLNRSIDEMRAQLPEIEREVRRIEESLKANIPELRKRIEEFAKSLNDALNGTPAEQAPLPQEASPSEPTTTAI